MRLSCIHWLVQAFHKLDEIATHHTEKLRKLTKQVQENRQSHDDEAVKRAVEEYDETLERYTEIDNPLINVMPHCLAFFPISCTASDQKLETGKAWV